MADRMYANREKHLSLHSSPALVRSMRKTTTSVPAFRQGSGGRNNGEIMGTNYYLHEKPDCECCGRSFEPLHIGKSSYGWCFSLHVMPGIKTLDDWRNRWSMPGSYIRNEYGDLVSVADMELIITGRRGPNGLLRHQIDGHCVGHGEGTWDYISGEFS